MKMNRACKQIIMLVLVFFTCFFLFIARHRLIDGDEGFYLMASRLVLEHKAPYLDFLYTQAPLLPYAYGLWMKLFGISWFSARSLSAMLTTILGLLIYEHVCRETEKWTAGAWHGDCVRLKHLDLCVVPDCEDLFADRRYFFSVLMQLLTRLTRGIFTMAGRGCRNVIWAQRGYSFVCRRARCQFYSGGYFAILRPQWNPAHSLVPWRIGNRLIPCLYLLVSSPDVFLFNNLGYHAIRSHGGLIGEFGK